MAGRRFALLLALGVLPLTAACARRLPWHAPIVASRPSFDRSAERRAVLAVVLAEHGGRIRRLVIDTTLEAPAGSGGPPEFEGAREETRADWKAHARPRPAPEDLRSNLPIEWFSQGLWEALGGGRVWLDHGEELEDRWRLFDARFPHSSGWISFSDVGFSPCGDEALLSEGCQRGALNGSGRWLLLRKRGGRWTIVAEKTAWVS
jgi:hypothetical protein